VLSKTDRLSVNVTPRIYVAETQTMQWYGPSRTVDEQDNAP